MNCAALFAAALLWSAWSGVLTWYWDRMLLWTAAIVQKTIYIGNKIPLALKMSNCKIYQEGESIKWHRNWFNLERTKLGWTGSTVRKSNAYSNKCKWVIFCSTGERSKNMSQEHKDRKLQRKKKKGLRCKISPEQQTIWMNFQSPSLSFQWKFEEKIPKNPPPPPPPAVAPL